MSDPLSPTYAGDEPEEQHRARVARPAPDEVADEDREEDLAESDDLLDAEDAAEEEPPVGPAGENA